MSNRYLVYITTPTFTPITVTADCEAEAKELALQGDGDISDQWAGEPVIDVITKIED